MRVRQMLMGLFVTSFATIALADLDPWVDYESSEGLTNVTTVKVDSNMIDRYLEGLRDTWAQANKVSVELGHIEAYNIYVSELPNSGEFNVVLVVAFKDSASLQPNKARYEAFMKSWGEANRDKSDKIVQTYPDIRHITGEYYMREVTFK